MVAVLGRQGLMMAIRRSAGDAITFARRVQPALVGGEAAIEPPKAKGKGRRPRRRCVRLEARADLQAQLHVGRPPAQAGFALKTQVQLAPERNAKTKADALAVGQAL